MPKSSAMQMEFGRTPRSPEVSEDDLTQQRKASSHACGRAGLGCRVCEADQQGGDAKDHFGAQAALSSLPGDVRLNRNTIAPARARRRSSPARKLPHRFLQPSKYSSRGTGCAAIGALGLNCRYSLRPSFGLLWARHSMRRAVPAPVTTRCWCLFTLAAHVRGRASAAQGHQVGDEEKPIAG